MRNKEYRDSFVAANISNTISVQIHTMREGRKWTQTELASRCDMRQSRISALEDPECENVEIATLRRVASAFDVALIVRFAPFSQVARLSTSLKSSDFNVADYSADSLSEAKVKREPITQRYYIRAEVTALDRYPWVVTDISSRDIDTGLNRALNVPTTGGLQLFSALVQ